METTSVKTRLMGRAQKKDEDFRKEFENIMEQEDNLEAVEEFMAKSDEHPRFVWRDLLLSCPSKNKSQEDTVATAFGSLTVTCLIQYFLDVLHRELFLDDFHGATGDQFGALHAAVLCGRPEIVKMLRGHCENRQLAQDAICRPLNDYLDGKRKSCFGDCFGIIKRAVLWTRLPDPAGAYIRVAEFLKDFSDVKDREDREDLRTSFKVFALKWLPLNHLHPSDEDEGNLFLWTLMLAWASTVGRRNIVEMFNTIWPQHRLTLRPFWKSVFPDSPESPAERMFSGKILHALDDEKKRLAVEKLVNIVGLVMKQCIDSFESSQSASCDAFMQGCSLYSLSYRFPVSTRIDPRDDLPESSYVIRNSRWTPLHLAAARGDHELVDALIESYELVRGTFQGEWTMPIKGTKSHTTKIEILLMESLYDSFKMTPLHLAVLGNHQEVVESLLKWEFLKSHFDNLDIFKRNAFQIACSNNAKVSIVKAMMLGDVINVNTEGCCGFTPLHWAAYFGAEEVVRFLVSQAKAKGILCTAESVEGHHPYRVAEDLGPKAKKVMQDLLESIPEVKDHVERVYRDRQVYVDAANAILVGAALIASVTYGGWLQPPDLGGFTAKQSYTRVFWAFNSLSFFFAIGTVIAGAEAVLPRTAVYIEDAVHSIRSCLIRTALLFICSILFVLIAFGAAGFEALTQGSSLMSNMIITTAIGGTLCIGLIASFSQSFIRIHPMEFKAQDIGKSLVACQTISRVSGVLGVPCISWPKKSCRGHEPGHDKASLEKVRKFVKKGFAEVQERGKTVDTSKVWRDSISINDLHDGKDKICPIRRCYLDLAGDLKMSNGWFNEYGLQANATMWNEIVENLTMREKIIENSKHGARTAGNPKSFLFRGTGGVSLLPYRTIQNLESKLGVVKVEKEQKMFIKQLESLNRQEIKSPIKVRRSETFRITVDGDMILVNELNLFLPAVECSKFESRSWQFMHLRAWA